MKKTWIFALIFFFLAVAPGNTEPVPPGIVKTISGTVKISRDGMTFRAAPAMPLHNGDLVLTGIKSFAGLMFKDGTVITLGPQSEFIIKTYIFEPRDQAYFFSFFMNRGSIIYNSGKIGKLSPQSVRLATPKATVGIRGTRFIVDLN